MYRRNITLTCLHSLTINELPRGIWIVVEREFFALSVLLHDESCFELRQLCTFRNLHSAWNVHTNMVRSEVKDRQIV